MKWHAEGNEEYSVYPKTSPHLLKYLSYLNMGRCASMHCADGQRREIRVYTPISLKFV